MENYRTYSCFLEQKKHKGWSVCYDDQEMQDTRH